MINGIKKETIVSTTEDRLTLLNWLKKLEKTLSDDTLTDIAFNDDNGNVSLVLTFEDGTTKSVAFPYDMSKFMKEDDSTYNFTLNNSKLSLISSHIVRQGNLVFVHIMLSVNENITGSQDYGIFNFTISHEHRGVTLSSSIGAAYWWAQANGKLGGYGQYNAGEYIDVEFFASIEDIMQD